MRLPEERWRHICAEHPEMETMRQQVCDTIGQPEQITDSRNDPDTVTLNYRRFANTPLGEKWICVVVKYLEGDAFVLTAYPTNSVR